MWMLVLVFFLGALTVVGAEAVGLAILMRWLNRRVADEVARSKISRELSSRGNIYPSLCRKQGFVWVLDVDSIPRAPIDKAPRHQKAKKDILEVTPIKKYANLKNRSLILVESDSSSTEIELTGCTIAAVSASDLPSRKWAKRYPIKVESKSSTIYKGSKVIYVYLETSWEKESWCKALYIATCEDAEKLKWFSNLYAEFQNYMMLLTAVYPSSFIKQFPHDVSIEPSDNKSNKLDISSSKVRNFLRKLSKKASKSGLENKANLVLKSSREVHAEKPIGCSTEEIMVPSSLPTLNGSVSGNHVAVISDADSDDKASNDGTLCWNLLISRLFFDAKRNAEMRTSLLARIQRTLSNMRSPTYIGEVICTDVNLGNLPPYIHAMKVLPSNVNEVWMMEIDIEYSGGAIFEIETRLEVQDLELQEAGPSVESRSVDEVKADLLEGIEHFRENMTYSEETAGACDHHRDEGDLRGDSLTHSKSTSGAVSQYSRWKYIMQSIAKQVSQVPLTLGIRVASLRGLMRIFIRPPPSDQIWFGFTSMPDLDFQLEPFVGEHRIASGRLALFLISRFKVAIRETLVLPNCESVCLPWMLAEKENWVPRKLAPFIWINQEPRSTENADVATPEAASSSCPDEGPPEKIEPSLQKLNSAVNGHSSLLAAPPEKELRVPLLSCEEQAVSLHQNKGMVEEEVGQNHVCEDDGAKTRRLGSTKARMIGLSKKMSEKFEEKRRHIEEKGRNIVEKMRGQQ